MAVVPEAQACVAGEAVGRKGGANSVHPPARADRKVTVSAAIDHNGQRNVVMVFLRKETNSALVLRLLGHLVLVLPQVVDLRDLAAQVGLAVKVA